MAEIIIEKPSMQKVIYKLEEDGQNKRYRMQQENRPRYLDGRDDYGNNSLFITRTQFIPVIV